MKRETYLAGAGVADAESGMMLFDLLAEFAQCPLVEFGMSEALVACESTTAYLIRYDDCLGTTPRHTEKSIAKSEFAHRASDMKHDDLVGGSDVEAVKKVLIDELGRLVYVDI